MATDFAVPKPPSKCPEPSRLLRLLEKPTYVPHVLEKIVLYACPAAQSLCTRVAPLCTRLRAFVYSRPSLWRKLEISGYECCEFRKDIDALGHLFQRPQVCKGLRNLCFLEVSIKASRTCDDFLANRFSKLTTLNLTSCTISNWDMWISLARATPNLNKITINSVKFYRRKTSSEKAPESDRFWPGLKNAAMKNSCADAVLFALQQSCSLESCEIFEIIGQSVASQLVRQALYTPPRPKILAKPCADVLLRSWGDMRTHSQNFGVQ